MPSRRQQKMSRAIIRAVSDAIANHLNDPRIEGFVSITRVNLSGDLHKADVYVSILGKNGAAQRKTFAAIEHAHSRIQSLVAGGLHTKFCPALRFHLDEDFKKTIETMRIITETASQSKPADNNQIDGSD